ncbi:MAG TPA: hypothetical protein VFU24_01790 [Burkholderiales bacterium]|nr:hypothetical protein [Burkholderiales bacterium]
MPKADFIAKLRQIEELANAVVAELTPGVAHTRVQHIVVLVKTLRGRLEFGSLALVSAQPTGPAPDEQAPV